VAMASKLPPTMRRRGLVLIGGILLAGLIVSFAQTPASPERPQGTGRIRGRVTAADTGMPLRGVQVGAFSETVPPYQTI